MSAELPILNMSKEQPGASGTFVHLIPDIKSRDAPFDASVFIVEPGCCSKEDRHEVTELWILTQGEGVLYYSDQEYVVRAPCALMFTPNQPHRILNKGNNRMLINSIWWKAE